MQSGYAGVYIIDSNPNLPFLLAQTPSTFTFITFNPYSPYSSFPLPQLAFNLTQLPTTTDTTAPIANTQIQQVDEEGKKLSIKIHRKREKNADRERISARKNSESNLINHFFAWYSNREWSQWQVCRIIKSLQKSPTDVQKIVPFFYNIIRVINLKRARKYINKTILMSYFTEQGLQENIPEVLTQLQKSQLLKRAELFAILRKCVFLFLRQDSLTSILTSKRISTLSKQAHLDKRRKMAASLREKFAQIGNNF